MRGRSLLSGILLSCLGFGCGDSEITPKDYAVELTETACTRLLACWSSDELEELLGSTVENERGCRLTAGLRYGSVVSFVEEGEDASRLRFRTDVAKDCIRRASEASCDDLSVFLATECLAPIEPRVPIGGVCKSSWECIEGACLFADEASILSGLVCRALPGAGEACVQGKCAAEAYCDIETAICQAKREEGEACSYDEECGGACLPYEEDVPRACAAAPTEHAACEG